MTAAGLCVEVADWHRFTGATIGAYLGLVPSESSSGARRVQGGITKTGNSHARRLLVEAAWHHRRPAAQPGTSPARRRPAHRGAGPSRSREPAAATALVTARARGKRPTVSVVAVARELAGWCWSLAVLDEDARPEHAAA